MVIAIVQIPLAGEKRSNEELVTQFLDSTKIFHEVKGLRRKYFLSSEAGAGGIYEFASPKDAEAWFHDGWADWMESRFSVRPTLALFDNPVVLDNETGEVRVNGAPVPAPWKESD